MGLFNIFKKEKLWVRWYSVDPGVADLHPWSPARKLHRPWRTKALKAQGAVEILQEIFNSARTNN